VSIERLKVAEHNIEAIRVDVNSLRVEEARQTEQLVSIRESLVRHDGQFYEITRTLTAIQAAMQTMSDTLVRNTVSLEDHVRRTTNLENRIAPLEQGHWKATGMFVLASAIGGVIVTLAVQLLQ